MAPAPSQRRMVPKDRFNALFGTFRTQTYHDPSSRGPGSHTLRTLAWNPSGQLIATGSADRTLRIWNPERAHVKYSTELRGHTGGIEKVLFNPTRESELASCSSDGTVRFWDVRSKSCIQKVDVGGEAFTLAWSADGKHILVGKKDDELIPISISYPTIEGETIIPSTTTPSATATYTSLPAQQQTVQTNATTFSHHIPTPTSSINDYDLLLTTGMGSVSIVSYPTFQPLHTLHAHTSACLSLSLAPNGHYLAIGGSDALISLWDTQDWICRRTLSPAGGGAVRGVSWSWDGRFIVAASDELGGSVGGSNGGLEIFHAETGEAVYTIPVQGGNGVPAVAWHPSRYWLAYSVTDATGLRIVGAGGGGGSAW